VNRTYRLVWSEVTQRYVPAAERAPARGKSGGSRALKRLGAVVLVASLGYIGAAEAAPTGGVVAAGRGAIVENCGTTTVWQQSQNLSLNWADFSIGSSETVRFVQPSSTSVALNRVTGANPSQIFGQLQANGQVFLLNPNGVLFKPGAQVNVGALVASTLKLSDADFKAGHYEFRGGSTAATVDNQGHVTAAPGGYVAFLGPTVSNNGTLDAKGGTVLLAAAKKVSLQVHNGSLVSYSIDQGALHALAENNQLIQADGGHVFLTAQGADSASKAVVNNTGIIEARTVDNHNGVIRLVGDGAVGQVNVGGTLDASASHGGNGGTVETSAAQVTVADTAYVTTAAPAGKTGTWSVSQADLMVAASGGDISGATLSSELANTNVTLATTSGKLSGHGDISVEDAVSWSSNTTLALNAAGNVQLNGGIKASGNTAGLVLNYGSGDNYTVGSGSVTLSGKNPSLSIGGHAYTVINSLGDLDDWSHGTLQGIRNNLSGYYALGSDIDASATSAWSAFWGSSGFRPLGTASRAFTGQFAGLGHVISNLTIQKQRHTDVGLFGVTGASSVIRDVGLNGGTVVGGANVGALVGLNQGKIIDSYATVSVSGQRSVGGLVGENSGTISTSYATSTVTGFDKITGGLVGLNNGTIVNSYATGSVTGHHGIIGGLVGENSGLISNSYAAGKVSGSWYEIGGLVGENTGNGCNDGTVSNSFWDVTTSGQADSDGGIGMTTAQMQNRANFTSATAANGHVNPGWDFGNVWFMYNGSSYPLLKSFLKPIVITANNVSVVYTGAAWNGIDTYTCTGACAGLTGTIRFGGPAASAVNVGQYSIVPSGLNLGQQGYALTYVPGQLTITPAALTITGLAASNKVYDGSTAAVLTGIAKISPFGSDNVTLSGTGIGTFDSRNVGTGKSVTVTGYTLSGSAAGNYTLVEPTGLTANITPAALAISGVVVSNKVYDTTAAATLVGTATVTGLGKDSVSLSGTGHAVFADKNVGTDKSVTITGYTLVGADAGNYTLVTPTGLTANITPANLLISGLTASNKVYDTTVNAKLSGTATVTALKGDSVTLSGTGTGVFSDKNAGTGKLVTVSGYTLSGADAGNYNLVEPSLTANISRASLAITGVTANNKVYDTNTDASLSGTARVASLGSDNVVVIGPGTGSFSDKNVGTNKSVTVSGYSLAGIDAGNYVLVQPIGLTASITPAPLAITGVGANNKVYDTTIDATLVGTAGVTGLGADSVAVGGTGHGVFADKNVGTDKAVTVTGYTLVGADARNYTVVQPTDVTANIVPANLVISGLAVSNKVYDTTVAATLSGTGAVTALAGDRVTLSGTAKGVFSDKNAGTGKLVTVSGYTLSGADAGNYNLVEPSLTADITPATLAISGLTANNKVYDTTTFAALSGHAVVTALGSDRVVLSGSGIGTFSDKNVGTDKVVTVGGFTLNGPDAGNYTLTGPTGLTANISPVALTLTGVAANNKVYDGTVAASLTGTATVTPLSGDTVTVVGTGRSVFGDKNAGLDKAVTVSGYSLSGADAGNYTLIEPANLTANVAARPLTISATASNRVYDGLTDAAVTLSDDRVAGDALVTSYSSAAFVNANAGSGKTVNVGGITLSGVDAGNYIFNTTATTTANITRATLTVSANNASKVYDGLAYSGGNGVTYSGFVAGQLADVLSGTVTYGGTSQGAIDAGSYTIIPGGLSSNNYAITFVNGTLTVQPGMMTVATNQVSKLSPASVYTASIASQAVASSSSPMPYDDASQNSVNTGNPTHDCGGSASDTCSVRYVNGTLTIMP
jgi:filamentous hemagglutinin family protein